MVVEFALRKGSVFVRLFPEIAPRTVGGIRLLVDAGFYTGLLWNPVVPNDYACTGCPFGLGKAGVTTAWPLEVDPSVRHIRGALTLPPLVEDREYFSSSLLHILFRDKPELDGRQTVAGQVVAGLEFLEHLKPEADRPAATVLARMHML